MALLDRPLGDSRTPDQRRAARVAAGIVDTVGILSTWFVSAPARRVGGAPPSRVRSGRWRDRRSDWSVGVIGDRESPKRAHNEEPVFRVGREHKRVVVHSHNRIVLGKIMSRAPELHVRGREIKVPPSEKGRSWSKWNSSVAPHMMAARFIADG